MEQSEVTSNESGAALPFSRTAPQFSGVYDRIRSILDESRSNVMRSVNTEMVRAYWLIGRKISAEELQGQSRAGYGEQLIDQLSVKLQAEFGRGFGSTSLKYMRLFYLAYPKLLTHQIRHTVCDESADAATLAVTDLEDTAGRLNQNYKFRTKLSRCHPYGRNIFLA